MIELMMVEELWDVCESNHLGVSPINKAQLRCY
jgi:hypothetical protein